MTPITPAQADALLRWIMECNDTPLQLPIGSNPTPMTLEEPAMTQRNFRKLDALLFIVITACALVLWIAG